MKLDRYDVTIIIADPNDPECHVKVKLSDSGRDAILASSIVGPLLRMFEESIPDDDEEREKP